MQIIVPEFSDGLKINWERAFPIDRGSVGVHVTKDLVIGFEEIYNPKTETMFKIGDVLEDSPLFDCKDFDKKMREYKRFGQYKSTRFFKGERASIFFDPDEAEVLRKAFEVNKYTCIVSLYDKGEKIDVTMLTPRGAEVVKKELMDQGAVFPLPMDRYFSYINIRKVKIINDEKGGKNGMKKGWWILGAVILNVIAGFFIYKGSTANVVTAEPVDVTADEEKTDGVEGEIVDTTNG